MITLTNAVPPPPLGLMSPSSATISAARSFWRDGPDGLTIDTTGSIPRLSKVCPVLFVGTPKRKGPVFMRLVHGKHAFWAAYDAAKAACLPGTVELLGVVRGRWRLFVVRRDPKEAMEVAKLLPRRGGRKRKP